MQWHSGDPCERLHVCTFLRLAKKKKEGGPGLGQPVVAQWACSARCMVQLPPRPPLPPVCDTTTTRSCKEKQAREQTGRYGLCVRSTIAEVLHVTSSKTRQRCSHVTALASLRAAVVQHRLRVKHCRSHVADGLGTAWRNSYMPANKPPNTVSTPSGTLRPDPSLPRPSDTADWAASATPQNTMYSWISDISTWKVEWEPVFPYIFGNPDPPPSCRAVNGSLAGQAPEQERGLVKA